MMDLVRFICGSASGTSKYLFYTQGDTGKQTCSAGSFVWQSLEMNCRKLYLTLFSGVKHTILLDFQGKITESQKIHSVGRH